MKIDFGLNEIISQSSPATPIEFQDSDWLTPTDLNGVQETINDVRIMLADAAHSVIQMLQDLQSDNNPELMEDAERLAENANEMLKALKVGVHRTLPSANSVERNGIRSQMHMLHTLAASVCGLIKSLEHAFTDCGILSTYITDLNSTKEEMRGSTQKIMSILNEIPTEPH